jgi:hypothetical protein
MEFGSTVESLFSRGIDAWKDIEVSKNYAANDSRPTTRAADGSVIPEGENGFGVLSRLTSGGAGSALALAVVGGLIVWLIVRRLK